ncbi:hypothetical protein [Mesorhizobium sp.]|uniref:hypothetical protein n=1 Tax=Mesorhizobium sp. TaxID=1871066 RepID=UPI000FE7BA25|nr:hypothetical protein [Mesorhizobium sp.]RWC64224.1 MAG: hypothetical protein EOS56_00550 [Mesorhizobium sp.]RWC67090.1 MAG: hypothetical protein EOS29_01385 [Mesorhizobium sp.]
MATPRRRTPAENAHAQAGPDKTPGFDPAAAPLSTDAEAADAPNLAGHQPPENAPRFKNEASYADATRPMEDEVEARPDSNWPLLVIAALVFIAAAVFVAASLVR